MSVPWHHLVEYSNWNFDRFSGKLINWINIKSTKKEIKLRSKSYFNQETHFSSFSKLCVRLRITSESFVWFSLSGTSVEGRRIGEMWSLEPDRLDNWHSRIFGGLSCWVFSFDEAFRSLESFSFVNGSCIWSRANEALFVCFSSKMYTKPN